MKHHQYKRLTALLLLFFALAFLIVKIYPQKPIATHTVVVKKIERKKIITAEAAQLLIAFENDLNDLMQKANTPGAAVVVVKDSTIVYMKGFGVKANGSPEQVDVNTVFRIGSVSKCFASTLTGILVEDKILNWDDKVASYLPQFCLKSPEQTACLSIRHVLSHTTGLPYHTFTNMVEEGLDINTLLSKLGDVNLCSKVGQTYSYQNVAYSIIGEVMKSATGKSYEELMTEKVFGPLHMKNASLSYDAIMSNSNIAQPHRRKRGRWVPTKINDTYYNVAPAGGVNASIADMANWLVALMGNKPDVITKETLAEMFTPYVKARSKNRNYRKVNKIRDSYYGMGWRILHYPNDTLVYHGGFVNGYRSEVAIEPKDKIAICILANAPGDFADKGIPAFFELYFENRDKINTWFDDVDASSKPNTFASIN